MVRYILSVLLVMYGLSAFCGQFYWSGGSGAWSDLTRWKKNNGGAEVWERLPEAGDIVCFSASGGGTVTVDVSAQMEELQVSAGNYVFSGTKGLTVYGQVTLHSDTRLNTLLSVILADSESVVFNCGNAQLQKVIFDGVGEVALASDVNASGVVVKAGITFRTNSKNLYFKNMEVWPGAIADLGYSRLTCTGGEMRIQGTVPGKNHSVFLNNASISNFGAMVGITIVGECSSNMNIDTDSLILKPGAKFSVNSESINVHKRLHAVGTENLLVFLGAWQGNGGLKIICDAGADVNVGYAILRNLNNQSGYDLTATHAVDMGNNFHWIINSLVGKDFYWKGGDGYWEDVNSWRGPGRLPTAVDNVYVEGDAQIDSKNLSYLACKNFTQKAGTNMNLFAQVDMFGDVKLQGTGQAFYIRMYSEGEQNFFMSADYQIINGLEMKFVYNSLGGQHNRFDLLSPVRASMMYVYGSLQTNGHSINVDQIGWHKIEDRVGTLNMTNTNIDCRIALIEYDDIRSSGSRIIASGGAYNRKICTDIDETNMYKPARDFLSDKADVHIEGDTIEYVVLRDRGVIRELNALKLELRPDSDVSLLNDIFVKELVMRGKPDSLIKLSSPGGQSLTLYGGNQQADYVIADNVHVSRALIQVKTAYFLTRCTNWDYLAPMTPQTLYWVGGKGNWSDMSHWATTSGGTVRPSRIPFACDKVIIDNNSGLNAADTVFLNLLNAAVADLHVNMPCNLAMKDRGRKLNVCGDLILADGVAGSLYEVWLWGNFDQESQAKLPQKLKTDWLFQLGGKYSMSGNINSVFYNIYQGKVNVENAVVDLLVFRGLTDKVITFDNCRVDVADWQVNNGVKCLMTNTLVNAYPRNSEMPLLAKNIALFWPSPESVCDRVHFYGGVSAKGFTGRSLYVAPYSEVSNVSESAKLDTLLILGAVDQPTIFNGFRVRVNDYAYINGASMQGMKLNRPCSAWHSVDKGLNANVVFENKAAYSTHGVQILDGGHICNAGTATLKLLALPDDNYRWLRNDTLMGIENVRTVPVNRGGRYYCHIDGKLRRAETNVFEVLQERSFSAPAVTVTGDSIKCVTDPAFDVLLTAINTDRQPCQGYKWFFNGNPEAQGSSPQYRVSRPGIYTVEVYGWACKSGPGRDVGLYVANDVPDAGLMLPLPVGRHCQGDTIEIGIEPVNTGVIPVYYSWKKDGGPLSDNTNTVFIEEDGLYGVAIGNACGFTDTWTELPVRALQLPDAPVQEILASHCGPGDVEVVLNGTDGYLVRWYDEDKKMLKEDWDSRYTYADVVADKQVYAAVVDGNGCVSVKTPVDIHIYEVATLHIGDFAVDYKDSIFLEPIDVPLNGSFQWLPCDEKLVGCTSRVPLFRSNTDLINKYRLEYTSPDGCVSVDSTTVKVVVEYKFPVVFTPNGDGYNDYWEVYGLELCPDDNQLSVYDRMGKLIYEAKPYRNDWDGKSDKGEQLPPGTYVFHFSPDGALKLSGMISIIRR